MSISTVYSIQHNTILEKKKTCKRLNHIDYNPPTLSIKYALHGHCTVLVSVKRSRVTGLIKSTIYIPQT